ncbi:type I restriction enzyme subunit R domain-containing protein, partial [Escherichia coli]|uniref:type I restriction enzyme subunit R domain-containing protein n=2 Tax=Gammaproteobacteria TaxID=1236 RepID=UPI0028DEB4B4
AGLTEKLAKYHIYRKMLANFFGQSEDEAGKRVEEFEKTVKQRFIKEPGRMRLLIVVDKLLTGFDAPSATYLYIDKKMADHNLFQAI